MRLLLITDGIGDDVSARVELACARLEGVDFAVQLRAKQASAADLFRTAASLVKMLDQRAPLLVNDRLDVARASGAAGVHLPSTGLPVAVARALWPTGRIGRSTHTLDEIAAAREAGADYVVYGPIAATPGKQPIGWESLRAAVEIAGAMPVYALGGIEARDVAALASVGADMAVIRAGIGGAFENVAGKLDALREEIRSGF